MKTIEKAVLPPVSSELLAEHERPERPVGGSPEQLLRHAAAYGAWCQKLAFQTAGWRDWYRQEQNR